MNPYIKNIDRIEFSITYACTGKCKHCSVGENNSCADHINSEKAAKMIETVCERFKVKSLMTFGGEPLLHLDDVCTIHTAATRMNIPKRQLITNGFFSKDEAKIKSAAKRIAECGINDLLLSADAFHQETIPLETVKIFAKEIKNAGVPIRISPAWLISKDDKNPYNIETNKIVSEFEALGIPVCDGNIIFPEGNAKKYLKEYFDPNKTYTNPYEEDPKDIRTLSIDPNGDVLGGNICREDILEIIKNYKPE